MSIPQLQAIKRDSPDFGHGTLGRFAHDVLSAQSEPPLTPQLYLGYNILPDPPFPMAGFLPYQSNAEVWHACGEDLAEYLDLIATSLRATEVPSKDAYSAEHHRLAGLLRADALSLAVYTHMVIADESPAGQALAANISEGYYRRGDVATSQAAQDMILTVACDRDGKSVAMWAPPRAESGVGDPICPDGTPNWPLLSVLRDILDTQFTWTQAVFGDDATGRPRA